MSDRAVALRRLATGALVGLCFGVLSGCDEQPGLVIGAVLPMSGPAAAIGADIRDGLTLAADEVNERGGLSGRPVVLVIEDGGGGVTAAQSAYDQITAAEVAPDLVVAGTSGVSMAVKDAAVADGRLLFGLVATVPALTRGGGPVYRYWPTAEQELPVLAEALPGGLTTLTVFHQDDSYGTSVFQQVDALFEGRPTRVLGASFPLSGTDFDALVSGAMNSDAVVVVGFAGHIRSVLRALDDQGFDGPVVSTTTATLPDVVSDPAADGVVAVAPAIFNKNYAFADAVRSRFEARYGRPFNQYAANGFDFVMMLAGLVEGSGSVADQLRSQLQQGFVYSGLFGNVSLPAGGRDIDFPLFPARISEGELIYR